METTPAPAPVAPAPSAPAPKKSRLWLWILLVIGILLVLGGIVVAVIIAGVFALSSKLENTNIDFTLDDSNTDNNAVYENSNWLGNTQNVGDTTVGYQLTLPSDWTLSSDDSIEGLINKNYEFTYYDDVNGTTTNHFVIRRDDLAAAPDTTLGQYSSDFVASLDEGIQNGDFKIVKTENRTFGAGNYQGYVVVIGNDTTGEQNYYVMTIQDGVAYELSVFYFKDQEAQALADFEQVIATFVAE